MRIHLRRLALRSELYASRLREAELIGRVTDLQNRLAESEAIRRSLDLDKMQNSQQFYELTMAARNVRDALNRAGLS